MEKTKITKEYDIYRDSLLRYLGYSNEVGEAFRPLVNRNLVNLSYGIAVTYVLADCFDKSSKVYNKNKDIKKTAIMAGDVFLWQMLASVIVPGFTINRITTLAIRVLRNTNINATIKKSIPTGLGLASIPFIIKPIDQCIDYVMDNTYRKLTNFELRPKYDTIQKYGVGVVEARISKLQNKLFRPPEIQK